MRPEAGRLTPNLIHDESIEADRFVHERSIAGIWKRIADVGSCNASFCLQLMPTVCRRVRLRPNCRSREGGNPYGLIEREIDPSFDSNCFGQNRKLYGSPPSRG